MKSAQRFGGVDMGGDVPLSRRARIVLVIIRSFLLSFALICTGLLLHFAIIPAVVFVLPGVRPTFYDLGIFGVYPERSYDSFNLTSPDLNILVSDASCKDGLVLLGVGGQSVDDGGPMILDMEGNLIWTSDQFPHAMNVQIQSYRGHDYLTLWSGEKLQESGLGSCYMLDPSYEIAHVIDAVGPGLQVDMHACGITVEDTAIITAYEEISAGSEHPLLNDTGFVDGLVQEIDVESGELLFEWRASEHIDPDLGYMSSSSGSYLDTGYFDYFHVNSIDKMSDGNYLVSIRHTHQLLCIDGASGDIVWALGGDSDDFEDLSDGAATGFMWQHDARWVSEEEGIISVFDNGRARKHHDRSYSQGLLIQLDFDAWTATLLQDLHPQDSISSASQGNVQVLDRGDDESHYFVGWGSSAAFSEFDESGQVLYEAHYGASWLFWFERVKSYRAFKTPQWKALPSGWNPSARQRDDLIYVSWNGATAVREWILEGHRASDPDGGWEETMEFDDAWKIIATIDKGAEFESWFDLPSGNEHVAYRVTAADGHGNHLRSSNIVTAALSNSWSNTTWTIIWAMMIALLLCGVAWTLGKSIKKKLSFWQRQQQYELVPTRITQPALASIEH